MKKWKCNVCGYIHEGDSPPDKCPVCQADKSQFTELSGLSQKMEQRLKEAFTAESKAHVRNRAFAGRAEEEGFPAIARLFRAVAEAERIHAAEYVKYFEGMIGDTEQNLRTAFENENKARLTYYPAFIKDALAEGRDDIAKSFTRARDVEERHEQLYKEALAAMASEQEVAYHVCSVCGYVFTGALPDECPVCQATREFFVAVD